MALAAALNTVNSKGHVTRVDFIHVGDNLAPPLARHHFFLGSKFRGENMKNPLDVKKWTLKNLSAKNGTFGGKLSLNPQKLVKISPSKRCC